MGVKKCINVEGMSKAGPYSHAVEAAGFIFISGVVPVDPRKEISITDDIQAATALVFENIKRVLGAAGTGLENVIKVTVFLRDMADFSAMNEVYRTYFSAHEPARSCVAVRELPGNFPVEIELVALK